MGLLDIFKRNKPKAIEAPKEWESKEEFHEGKIRVFSKKLGSNIEYSVKMDSYKGNINVGKFYKQSSTDYESNAKTLKEITREIKGIIDSVITSKEGKSLELAKQSAMAKLESMDLSYFNFEVGEDIIKYIETYEVPESINYGAIDRLVGEVNLDNMSITEIIKLGEQLSGRLETLDAIKTIDDVDEHKDAIIEYMKGKENIVENPIVDANIQSLEEGEKLDEPTLIKIAQNMEQIDNEDGVLYSAYLKLEEKRVLKQIIKVVSSYNLSKNASNIAEARKTNLSIFHMRKQINSIKGGFSPEILEYIISSMKQDDIKTYMDNYRAEDEELYKKVKDEFDIPEQDKKQILDFLSARIGCLGQLYYKGNKNIGNRTTLREFVENTTFKDPEDTESKEFLYSIAEIAREQIRTEYIPTLNKYRGRENNTKQKQTSFKERVHYSVEPIDYRKSQKVINSSRDTEKLPGEQ